MATFTNISNGPRGLHTTEGLVMVDAGKTVSVELAEGEDAAEEWFRTGPLDRDHDGDDGGSLAHEPAALSGKNKAELLAIAADEGVEVSSDDKNADIIAAIELAREAE